MANVTKPNRDMNRLNPAFRKKVEAFLAEAKRQGHAIMVFEGRRSAERQRRLFAQGRTRPGRVVTRTLNSRHLTGHAVDIVFIINGQPRWQGNYDALIRIGQRYGMRNLKPRETCHFEDDGTTETLNAVDFVNWSPPVYNPADAKPTLPLTSAQAYLMFKQLFLQENPQGSSIFKKPEDAFKLCLDTKGNLKAEEFYRLMLVGFERMKKQLQTDDARLADALELLS